MKVYTTKYALTRGIEVHDVQPGPGDEKYVYSREMFHQQFVMGKTAFLAYQDAALAAREMRDKKVASVRGQLNRLIALTFSTREPS